MNDSPKKKAASAEGKPSLRLGFRAPNVKVRGWERGMGETQCVKAKCFAELSMRAFEGVAEQQMGRFQNL